MIINNVICEIIIKLKGYKRLVTVKLFSMMVSLVAYSICVFYFYSDFVVVHASLMIVFGAYKAGAGFEAISTGKSAVGFISSSWIVRVFIAFSWLGIMAAVSNIKIAPLILPVGFIFSILWLWSFDGHITGKLFWSLINGLLPALIIISVGFYFLSGIPSLVLHVTYHRGYLFVFSIFIFIICLVVLVESRKNTVGEILHCTVSPLILFSLSSTYIVSSGIEFIFYRVCEGLAQLSVFVLSASPKDARLNSSVLTRLAVGCFFTLSAGVILSNYLTEIGVVVFFGIFIFFYYLIAFVIVRYSNKWSLGFILLAFSSAVFVNVLPFKYVLPLLFFVPIYLLLVSRKSLNEI